MAEVEKPELVTAADEAALEARFQARLMRRRGSSRVTGCRRSTGSS